MQLILFFVFCVTCTQSANILGIFNHPGLSHTFLGKTLLRELAERGHDVVMVSCFPLNEPVANYRDIFLGGILDDLNVRNARNKNKEMGFDELKNMTLKHTEATFLEPEVQKLLKSNQKFDIIIMDWFFNEATLIVGHIFKAPVVYISSFGNMMLLNDFTGNSLPYSYVPGAGLFLTDDLTFKQRFVMTLFNVAFSLFIPRRNAAHFEILKRHFDDPPTIEELQQNVALVLSNSHFSFETPRPYTPNIIPIGGFHVDEPQKLPKDLKEFLDGSKEGAVLFSLGSQLESSHFTHVVIDHILSAFGRLKQRVLWKFEGELDNLPENVKIVKWLPQLSVLAHPNLKLFITHGGQLSFIEAIHFGVPLICLPFNGDQLTNAAFISSRNMGLFLYPNNITDTVLYEAIVEIFKNPIYQEQATFRSKLLRKQPATPRDLAVHWIEHVIANGHCDHLKPFSTKLPFYKYYLLDIILFSLIAILLMAALMIFVLKKIFKLCKKTTAAKKNKTQ